MSTHKTHLEQMIRQQRESVEGKPSAKSEEQRIDRGNAGLASEYMKRGPCYTVVNSRQGMLMSFGLLFNRGGARTIEYAHITERWYDPGEGVWLIVRDTMRVLLQGVRLEQLDRDLRAQVVRDIGYFKDQLEFAAEAAAFPKDPVISRISFERGRFDAERGVWHKSNGRWSDGEERWIAEESHPMQVVS